MNNIKNIRKSQNMSVTELAKALNMSQSNLTKIENNQLELKHDTAQKIADILNVSISALHSSPNTTGAIIINPEIFNLPPLSAINFLPPNIYNTSTIKAYIAIDDTMSPTINKHSIVLIDSNKKELKNGIFLIKTNNTLQINRIQTTLQASVLLHFDNKSYSSTQIDCDKFSIIGEIVSIFNYATI